MTYLDVKEIRVVYQNNSHSHTMEQKQQVQNAFSFLFLGALILEFKSS